MTRQRFRFFLLQQGNINVDSGDDMEGGRSKRRISSSSITKDIGFDEHESDLIQCQAVLVFF